MIAALQFIDVLPKKTNGDPLIPLVMNDILAFVGSAPTSQSGTAVMAWLGGFAMVSVQACYNAGYVGLAAYSVVLAEIVNTFSGVAPWMWEMVSKWAVLQNCDRNDFGSYDILAAATQAAIAIGMLAFALGKGPSSNTHAFCDLITGKPLQVCSGGKCEDRNVPWFMRVDWLLR